MTSALMAADTGFLDRSISLEGDTYRYQVFVPRDWTADKKWPVILFLHGAGERGEDGLAQTQVGIGGSLRSHVDRWPAVVVMPQCRKGVWWIDPKMEAQALAALDQEIKEFNGDRDRVYLTGISMGGYGTWSLAARHPKMFAAIVPVCGGVRIPARANVTPPPEQSEDPYNDTAKKVAAIPAWVFHGEADPSVPVTESRKLVEALKTAGAEPHYTEYPGVGHNSWDRAYADPELPAWMFSQKLKRAE